MNHLSEKDIQFISNYLKNSGVEYLDIRLEMTDHIASTLEHELENNPELTFYDVFKNYMIQHKKSLLKNARKYQWTTDLKILKEVKIALFYLPVFLAVFGFAVILAKFITVNLINDLSFRIPFGIVILSAIALPWVLFYRLKISFLNRISVYAVLLNYLLHRLIDYSELSHLSLVITYSLIIWINLAVMRAAFKMSHYYKNQYAPL